MNGTVEGVRRPAVGPIAFASVPQRSWGLRSLIAHDHPIKPPGPHREGLRHLCRRKHHHRRCATDRVAPQPLQRPLRLGRLRLPSPRRDEPAALQPAATGRSASKPQRCRPWRDLTCHRECPRKPCCAFPTCWTASASADARCVDGAPTAHSPKPSGWARTPSAGPAASSTSGSPTGPLQVLDALDDLPEGTPACASTKATSHTKSDPIRTSAPRHPSAAGSERSCTGAQAEKSTRNSLLELSRVVARAPPSLRAGTLTHGLGILSP